MAFNYGYNYNYNYGATDFSFAEFMSLFAIMMAVTGAISLVFYILRAVAMMKIAKGRGFSSPWIAWIPFANLYQMGKVADDICYRNGKKKSYRKVLLGLNIATVAGVVLATVLSCGWMINTFLLNYDLNVDRFGNFVGQEPSASVIATMVVGVFIFLAAWIVAVIQIVFYCIVLYQIFKDYAPKEAVLFLILSIFLSGIFDTIALLVVSGRPAQSIVAPVGRWENGYFVYNPAGAGYGYGVQPPVNPAGQPVVGFDPYNQPYAGGYYQPPVPPQAPQAPANPQPPVPPQEPPAQDPQ